MRPMREPAGPGRESVWDYPRPARAEATRAHLRIEHRGVVVAETRRGVRTLETSHPPTYYFPPEDVAEGALRPARGASLCEWKGQAAYFDVIAGAETLARAAWTYRDPSPAFSILKDHVAFYPARFEACFVDGERARPQEGAFYGGWITSALAGPFKGPPGTQGW